MKHFTINVALGFPAVVSNAALYFRSWFNAALLAAIGAKTNMGILILPKHFTWYNSFVFKHRFLYLIAFCPMLIKIPLPSLAAIAVEPLLFFLQKNNRAKRIALTKC